MHEKLSGFCLLYSAHLPALARVGAVWMAVLCPLALAQDSGAPDRSDVDGPGMEALLTEADRIDGELSVDHYDVAGDLPEDDLSSESGGELSEAGPASGQSYSALELEEVEVRGQAGRGEETRLRLEIFLADVHIDALSSVEISRNGDSTAAASLVRLPGLSLVDEKYVYVRGLGERYSSNTLNFAFVPSPDLTRDVLPLDMFPTSIIESVAVRKSYDVDRPAAFGGGEIQLRTKSIPEEFFFEIDFDLGTNTDLDNYKTYPDSTTFLGTLPDSEAGLSQVIRSAVSNLGGRIDPLSIADRTNTEIAEAEAINRSLATEVNRDFRIYPASPDPDYGISLSGGDRFSLQAGESALGYIAYVSFDQSHRHYDIINRGLRNPEQDFSITDESRKNIDLTAYASVGMELGWNQRISANYTFLRNTTDRTHIEDVHHSTFNADQRRRRYWLRFESQDLSAWQIQGSHGPEDLVQIKWHVSLAKVFNDLPSELDLETRLRVDAHTGAPEREFIRSIPAAADLGYTTLSGRTNSYALATVLPIGGPDRHKLEFGLDATNESRTLDQMVLLFGSATQTQEVVGGNLLGTFGADYINDPDNRVELRFRGDTAEPYQASARHFGTFALFRLALGHSWRLGMGLRWERYDHGTNLRHPVSGARVGARSQYGDSKLYPSFSALYSSEGNGWSDIFQLRISYGRTVVRPDAREISSAVYIHPLTNARIKGNSGIVPSFIDNINVSVSWRFDSQESLGLAVFYKNLSDPIEFFEAAVSDDGTGSQRAQEIANAENASIYGIELQGRVNIVRESFFFSGNLAWLSSRLETGDLPFSPTSTTRSLTNASDYVVNLSLGYLHPDGSHSLRLIYNLFGERLHYAGRNGAPDAFEQPAQWLNLNYLYSFGPGFKLQFKVVNLLDEEVEIERGGQVIYSRNIGREFTLGFSWRY